MSMSKSRNMTGNNERKERESSSKIRRERERVRHKFIILEIFHLNFGKFSKMIMPKSRKMIGYVPSAEPVEGMRIRMRIISCTMYKNM